jgi:hypothetical protein
MLLVSCLVAPARGADETIVCPPGTQRERAQRPSGSEEWCERPGTNPRILEGPFVSRHPDGAVQARGAYRDGKPSGTWKSWHPDGAQSGEVTFVGGKPNGMLLGWYPSGQASFVGGFRDGTPIGAIETFDADGRLRSSVDFGPDGTERGRRAWDDAHREIDPRSGEAHASQQRAFASSPLIHMALMAAAAWR